MDFFISFIDVFLIIVLVGTALHYAHKGFVAGIVHLVGNLLSLFVAWFASSRISPAVFENFFKNGLVDKTRLLIESQGDINLEMLVERFAGFLPDSLKQNILQAAAGLMDTSTPNAALTVVETIIAPLLVPIISVVVFFITFALCRLVVSLLAAVLTTLNHVPILGSMNKLLGFVTGLGAGIINVVILLCAAWAAVIILGGKNPYWNEAILAKSWFYRLFAPYNPFI